jgi:hypothetical protein
VKRLDEKLKDVLNDCVDSMSEVQKSTVDKSIKLLSDALDILGDDYDLGRLRELMNQRMTMREDVAERMKLVGSIPMDTLRETIEALRDGRCVVYKAGYPIASQYYKDEDGLCIREVSGVVEEEEYYKSVFDDLSPEAQKLYNDILTGECLKGGEDG